MKTYGLVLLLLGLCGTAHAGRDIVYSARYYAPPGSRRTSHFHLYRINPDGTGRTQLTFGSGNDDAPRWSSNGRRIVFAEYTQPPSKAVFYEINASGGGRHLVKLPKGADWPPEPASGYRWEHADSGSTQLPSQAVLVELKTGRWLTVYLPAYTGPDPQIGGLLPVPGTCRTVVYSQDEGNSGTRPDNAYYLLDTRTGKMTLLTGGQFLAWAPDRTRFCTAEARYLVDYGKPVNGYQKSLYVAELEVGRRGGLKAITHGLCWVMGADWRKEK